MGCVLVLQNNNTGNNCISNLLNVSVKTPGVQKCKAHNLTKDKPKPGIPMLDSWQKNNQKSWPRTKEHSESFKKKKNPGSRKYSFPMKTMRNTSNCICLCMHSLHKTAQHYTAEEKVTLSLFKVCIPLKNGSSSKEHHAMLHMVLAEKCIS